VGCSQPKQIHRELVQLCTHFCAPGGASDVANGNLSSADHEFDADAGGCSTVSSTAAAKARSIS